MGKKIVLLMIFVLLLASATTAFGTEPRTPSGIPLSEMADRIDEVIYETIHQVAPGVSIVVFKGDEIIFSKGYGYSHLEEEIPMSPGTDILEFGSASKMFIWVAVMQLVEQGILDLDEKIEAYLPEDFLQRIAFEKSFTLRDLMNHAGGFGGHLFDVMLTRPPADPTALEDALVLARPCQMYEPGTIGTYSNFGVALAALVVEYMTGKKFYQYERENILIPAGMVQTLNQPELINNQEFLARKANSYIINREGDFEKSVWTYFPLYPAGGLNGTAEDFARFAMALTPPAGEPGPFFEKVETLQRMFTPSSLDHLNRPGTHHGLWRWDGTKASYGHLGLTISFSTYFAVVPEQRFGFVVHTNASFGTALPLVVDMQELLIGVNPIQVTTEDLPSAQEVTGSFVLANRHDNFLLEFIDYTSLAVVTAVDENTISMAMTFMGAPVSATYIQVEPYTYRLVTGTPFMRFLYSELRFKMEDGVPIKIVVANGFDITALPPGREVPILIGTAILITINMIFFMLLPIILLIGFLVRRKKGHTIENGPFHLFSNGLFFCGTLFVLNHLIFLMRINTYVWRTTQEMMIHVWVNYFLMAITIGFFVGSVVTFSKGKIKAGRKVLYFSSVALILLCFIVLRDWNFFTFR